MKSTGIIKSIDPLGRFKIPKELLNSFDIKPKSHLQIYRDGQSIVLAKVQSTCIFCFSNKNIHLYKGKKICASCLKELAKWQSS